MKRAPAAALASTLLATLLLFLTASRTDARNSAPQGATPRRTVIRAGRLLDVRAGRMLTDRAILVEGERVRFVMKGGEVFEDERGGAR